MSVKLCNYFADGPGVSSPFFVPSLLACEAADFKMTPRSRSGLVDLVKTGGIEMELPNASEKFKWIFRCARNCSIAYERHEFRCSRK